MYIASAVIESVAEGIERVVISTIPNEKKEIITNDGTTIYLGYNIPLAEGILKAASKDIIPVKFYVGAERKQTEFVLKSYVFNTDERFYNKHRHNHVLYREKLLPLSSVYIYEQRCRCFSCYDKYGFGSIENICGIIPLAQNREKTIEMDMQKCKHCGKIFVDRVSLSLYERKYGKLALIKKELAYWNDDECESEYEYAPDSILSRNGYKPSLPTSKRFDIISNLIESGINKTEIKDHLAYLIKFHGKRCYKALPVWQKDLEYVNNYTIKSQDKICFK